ncbi:MAG: DUF349 domain-containing protein [Lentisphaerae bacterium]|nr:DUF349 domain-containing protein [Lentisphaerota bacterium]MBE6389136.1 DUF349 domain-containing protein [Lentisphaerota bacterium]
MSELTEELRNILHQKESICEALEKLENSGEIDYRSTLCRLSSDYDAAGELPPEYAELLDKRFTEALKTAEEGEKRYQEKITRTAKLADDTQALLDAGDLATLKEVEILEKTILELAPGSGLLEKLAPLKNQLAAEEAAVKAAENTVLKLAGELEELCALEDIAPLHDRKPGIEAEFAQLANIPRHAALKYNDAHRKASVKLAQHYETLDLARWEAYTRKLDICAELDKLSELPEEELANASKRLNILRESWKNLGSVPKEKSDEINPRYLESTRKLQHRIDEFFARKRQIQKISAAEKEKLCLEAESAADSKDWKNTAAAMRDMQTKWKSLPRAGAKENELFARFRAAQDKFFNARKTAFDERDKKFRQSEENKNALITEAENLTDPRRARQLRDEFRAAGFAGKNDQELYKKFNEAMDKFFEKRKAENASRENRANELVSEVIALCSAPAESLNRIREIREELRSLNCRETRQSEQQALRQFDEAFEEYRRQEQRQREENSDSIAMRLAENYDAWKNNNDPQLPDLALYAGFAKLQNMAKLLTEAIGGDEKAAVKLEKQIDISRCERSRICDALESLCGNSGTGDDTVDLAAELQFAMLGDFGKENSRRQPHDPHKLCAEFAACGIVPVSELQEFQRRFAAAKAVIFR